ncbi:hypothetical protein M8J77_021643 [Diaphorina citri]|nr:hypothetical protein M8J77_021643 [Diaphorina citri]
MCNQVGILLVLFLALVLIQFEATGSLKLPPNIKTCKKNDPQLDACIVKRARDGIPYLVKGFPKFQIPVLDPLTITSLAVDQGNRQIGLSLKLLNAQIHGLGTADFYKSKIDLKNGHWEWYFTNPKLRVLGKYVMDGKVLILPITGTGDGNITLTGITSIYTLDWKLYRKSDGNIHANITNSRMDFNVTRAYFDFKNLFNGDKALGAQMNNFMNENWMEVIREFGPAVGDAFNQVFRKLIQNTFDLVSFDQFFPE